MTYSMLNLPSLLCTALMALLLGCQDTAPPPNLTEGLLSKGLVGPQTDDGPQTEGLSPEGLSPKGLSRNVKLTALVGVLVARKRVDLSPYQPGTLASLGVALGQSVKAGETLAMMDSESMRSELNMAKAALRSAQAERRKAGAQLRHARRRGRQERALAAEGIVSSNRASDASLVGSVAAGSASSAGAMVANAEAQIEMLNKIINRSILVAPFAGVVAARFQDPGARVESGQPILRLISDELWIRFAAPPALRSSLVVGRNLRGQVEGHGMLIARVLNVAPELDPASGLVVVEATIESRGEVGPLASDGTPVSVELAEDDVVVSALELSMVGSL